MLSAYFYYQTLHW